MPKILFIGAHRKGRSPSQRFRFEQYLDYFEENGYQYELSELIQEEDDDIFYRPGAYLKKLIILAKGYLKRLKDVRRANNFDIIFVQREAFSTGTYYFEKMFSKSSAKLIFDFDDSIWLPNVSRGYKNLSF
ncbi:MAG: glycosyl transferase family 1, partial [Flavobacteriales bacterium]|nr:glycosyl transferase family 1 [Flavobacteriales bacterium]